MLRLLALLILTSLALPSLAEVYVTNYYPEPPGTDSVPTDPSIAGKSASAVAAIPTAPAITVYATGSVGNAAPLRTISGPATGLVYPSGIAVDALEYTLTFHSSSPKIEVKEDSSVNEAANAIKQSWSRKDEAAAAPAGAKGAAAKPGKGAAVVDESAARFAKAKEARERFLANRHGVFMPAAQANGKVVLQPSDDEAGHRYAPPAPVEPAMVPARLHQGFTADGAGLHGGVDGTDYNRKLENPSPVTAKPDIKATLERLQGDFTNGLREERKAATAAINDSVAALFAELRPGGIGEQPPVEADDKKKGATAGKKK